MRTRFTRFLQLSVAGLLILAAQRGGASEMSAAERAGLLSELRLVREKYPALSADFREERTTHLLTRPIVSEGRIYFEVPDRFRREVRGSSPSVTVSNGRTLWIYYPNFNQVEIYALGQRALFDDSLAALTAGLDFQSMEEFYSFDAYREQGGYRLVLKPKRSNLKRVVQQLELWLDAAFQARKTEITLPKGDHLTTIYSNTRRAPLQPATFEFEVPQGVAISRPLGK